MSDPDTQDQQQAPEVAFATKAEFSAAMDRVAQKATATAARKIAQLEAQLAEFEPLQSRLAELEAAAQGAEAKADAQRLAQERSRFEARERALQQQAEAAAQSAESLRQRWHEAHRREVLLSLAMQAGAAKSALDDIPALFPRDRIEIAEDETTGGLRAVFVDPATKLEVEPAAAVRAWLDEKPHLRGAPAGGSGGQGGLPTGVGRPSKFAGLSGTERFAAMLAAERKRG